MAILYTRFKKCRICILFIIGFSVTLFSSHLILIYFDKLQLESNAQNIMSDTRDIYKEASSIMLQAPDTSVLCSENDLAQLRDTLWKTKYIKDIARIKNNHIICSAEWGNLETPIALPPPTKAWPSAGIQHWRAIPDLRDNKQTAYMLSNTRALIVMSPHVYEKSFSSKDQIRAVIAANTHQYVFRYFNTDTSEILKQAQKGGFSLHSVLIEDCSASMRLCTIIEQPNAGLFSASKALWILLVAISILVGVVSTYIIYLLKNRRQSMLYKLKKAIYNDALYVEYQPKIALSSQQVVGVEVLIRWHDEQLGSVPPDIFIALAEENNLITKLSHLVIKKSLKELSELLHQHPNLTTSINLSMQDILDKNLFDFLDQQVALYGISHHRLIVEITERSAVGFENIECPIHEIVKKGYKISLDDFGTGYANLSWLTKLQANEIKVDKSFTQAIGTESINQNMLNAIFNLLKDLNVHVVFEGIEEQAQVDYILSRSSGAIGQGWLFAYPMSKKRLETFLIDWQESRESQNTQSPSSELAPSL